MDMTIQEKFDIEVWFVLQKIKRLSMYRASRDDIEYRIYSPPNLLEEGMPFPIEEYKVIRWLEKEKKAIKINDPSGRVEDAEETLYRAKRVTIVFLYLETAQNFKKIDKEYEEKYQATQFRLKREDFSAHYGFDDKVFWLKRVGNSLAVINFSKKNEEGTETYYLMRMLVTELKKSASRTGEWVEIMVARKTILDILDKDIQGKDIDARWLSTTVGNLKKEIPSEYESIYKIEFDSKNNGYRFALKIPF